MPLYEYVCQECGNRFDALRSIKDADQPLCCTHCQSQKTTRLISVFNAHSGGKVIAGTNNNSACSGCSGGSCSTCGH